MTERYQTARSEDADRLVSEFLDQIVVRDASGNAVSAMLNIKEIKSILADAVSRQFRMSSASPSIPWPSAHGMSIRLLNRNC